MPIIKGREYAKGRHVIDGEVIIVVDDSTYISKGRAAEQKEPEPEPVVRFDEINVNTCEPEALEALDGVGKAAARRIVAGRPYASIYDLTRVKGVSERTVKTNKRAICV
jgi:DNA uptake protein ComE-like DNA-binding protein